MAFQWENSVKLATYLRGEKPLIPLLKSHFSFIVLPNYKRNSKVGKIKKDLQNQITMNKLKNFSN